MQSHGYSPERFINPPQDIFECIICTCIVSNPTQCPTCESLFCRNCIQSWIQANNKCPNRCATDNNPIKPFGRALKSIYNSFEIKCKNFHICGKTPKLSDLESHEKNCKPCLNWKICKKFLQNDQENHCSEHCFLTMQVMEENDNGLEIYKKIEEMLISQPEKRFKNIAPTKFKWKKLKSESQVEISDDGKSCFLKEELYIFRSVLGDQPFSEGVHYWELHIDPRTENEIKVGVSLSDSFDLKSAFCDYKTGFGYYGLGQLRTGSNSEGPTYGKKFKKEEVIGIFLNMTEGILSFSVDKEYCGVAFKSDELKQGPIWPAVSIVHKAGCKIVTGLEIPKCFFEER